MKIIKTFEEFNSSIKNVTEDTASLGKDSKVIVDDYTMDNGTEIKSTEIVGAIINSETEKEFEDYFYNTYGNGSFTETDMSSLVTYFNEYTEEQNAEIAAAEKEAEEEEEGGDKEDPLAGLDI